MTSEDIIQRLLDEKKISVKDALIMIKDLAKEVIMPSKTYPDLSKPVMYGIPFPNNANITFTSS